MAGLSDAAGWGGGVSGGAVAGGEGRTGSVTAVVATGEAAFWQPTAMSSQHAASQVGCRRMDTSFVDDDSLLWMS
jgi:hypothetical protein